MNTVIGKLLNFAVSIATLAIPGSLSADLQSGRCDKSPRYALIESLGAESTAALAKRISEIDAELGIYHEPELKFAKDLSGNFLYSVKLDAGVLKIKGESLDLKTTELNDVMAAFERIRKGGLDEGAKGEAGKKLQLKQKLLLLSMFGSPESGSGVAIAKVSKLLGFDPVVLLDGKIQHTDPTTGQVYYQDLSQLISLPAGDQANTLDLGGRAVSALSKQVSLPNTLKWSNSMMKASAGYDKATSSVKLDLSDKGSFFGVEVEKKFGSGKKKGFLLSAENSSAEGDFAVEAFGNATSGVPGADGSFFSNLLAGTGVTGYAKYDRLTGKIEFRTLQDHLGIYEFAGGLELKPFQLPIIADAQRVFRSDVGLNGSEGDIHTSHDRIGVVFDGRGSKDRAYIVNRSDVYLLYGLDETSAVGFRNALTAAFPTQSVGEFSVVLDLAKVLPNQGKNDAPQLPLERVPVSTTAKAEWRKSFSKLMEFGAEILYRKGADPDDVFSGIDGPRERNRAEIAGALRLLVRY